MRIGNRSNKGFSVVQMLIMLVAVTLFVGYFSPQSFTQFLGKKVAVSAAQFAESLRDARSAAKDRKTTVTLCKSADGKQCNARLQWQAGWMTFTDDNGNGKVDASDDEILSVNHVIDKGTTIGTHNVVVSSVTFAAAGHTMSRKGNPVAGKFIFCDGYVYNDSSRIVTFNYHGSVHVESAQSSSNTSCGG